MEEELPAWVKRLAVEVYGVLREYDALPRFRQMVDHWGQEHQKEHEQLNAWEQRRQAHFEEAASTDERLGDEAAGPPEEGWVWEDYRRPVPELAEGRTRIPNVITVEAWVAPDLTRSSKPEVAPLLPLRREHALSLAEKYTCLALVYDYVRRGTEAIPPWPWPEPPSWGDPGAMANAKKCLAFEAMCQAVPELQPEQEDWLRALLKDVEKDIAQWGTHSRRMGFAVSMLLALAGLVGPAFLCGRLLPSHATSLSQGQGMALAVSVALLVWIWVVDFAGAANPTVSDWPPYAAVHRLRLWLSVLLSAMILTGARTYIARLVSSP